MTTPTTEAKAPIGTRVLTPEEEAWRRTDVAHRAYVERMRAMEEDVGYDTATAGPVYSWCFR